MKNLHDSRELENLIIIEEVYETSYFNNNAAEIRTRIFQIISSQIVELRDKKMQRKLQFYSKFEAFDIKWFSFHKRKIKNDQWNEILNDYAQNSFRNKKEYRNSEKISDKHLNCHEKMDFRRSERKQRKRIKIS
jgi:hypothetical protein